ncbi:MAG TPA: hypothetical protein VM240_02395 [Verrucomicrobiae bacterium]|nr:hypothetical protein [Verrucomicrobiae bacterium]
MSTKVEEDPVFALRANPPLNTALGMVIELEGPVFFGQQDEDQFFAWLCSLTKHGKVEGRGSKIYLSLRAPVEDDTVKQLLVLCLRWGIDIAPLTILRAPSNRDWHLWSKPLSELSVSPWKNHA